MTKKDPYLAYGLITGVVVTAITIIFTFKYPQSRVGGLIADIPFCIGIILNAMAFSRLIMVL